MKWGPDKLSGPRASYTDAAVARLYSGQLCFGWVGFSNSGRRRSPLASQKVLR